MSRGKKVLVVSEIFWPEGGGAELATYLVLKLLRDAGFKITVITGTSRPSMIKDVKFYRTSLLGNWSRIKRLFYISLLSKRSWFVRLLQHHDMLYIPLQAYPLIPLAKKYGLRVIVHMHNYVPIRYHGVKYFFEPDKVSTLEELRLSVFHEIYANNNTVRTLAIPVSYTMYKASRIWLKHADTIICVSKRQAELVKKQLPSIAKKIEVVYNPLPVLPNIKKEIKNNKRLILYVGGREYIKGYHMLLQAVKELILTSNLNTHIKFIFVGKKFKRSLLLNANSIEVETLGHVSRRQIIKIHKYAIALVFPSICEEPLPYAIVESMLLKTIPIAPRAGGIPEIVDGTKGGFFLFEPGNIESFVNTIKKVINTNPLKLLKIGEEIRWKIIEKFSNEGNKLLDIFGI